MAAELINTRYEVIETPPAADAGPLVVSKARDVTQGRVVTLQVLPASRVTGGTAQRQAFLSAAHEAARLENPNIARVYDYGETSEAGDLFVVSEYVRGMTLKERIKRVAPFSLAIAADIGVAVAEALDAAHQAGVLHGDLRPEDVLLSPEGPIKVANFAYARAAAGETAPPTAAGDIHALGAVLYEMLTGNPPNMSGGQPPSPRALNPGVPPALEGIVRKALIADPTLRYGSAAAILADLQAVRDALKNGRSLAWSPLAENRVPRPSNIDSTVVGARPNLPVADDPRDPYYDEREPSNFLSIAWRVLFVVFVLGVIGFSWYLSRFLAIPNDITVPNLIGKTFDDANRLARQQHFTLVKGGEDYSTKWPENQIYQQDPTAGRTIKPGKDVNVFVSLGPRLLQVPDVVGMTKERAQLALKDANLPAGTTTDQYSETVPQDVVISQTPPSASMVARDTTVNYVISKGKQPPDMPADVVATAPTPDTAEIKWSPSARADTYTVIRTDADGNDTQIATGLKDTQITDSGLKPDTSYTYTVIAYNPAGKSDPGVPAPIITPASPANPPVLGDVRVAPPDTGANGTDGSPSDTAPPAPDTSDTPARMRQFNIRFRVPRHPRGTHHIQFQVEDATGTSMVYDEMRDSGSQIDAPISAFGNKVTFFIYVDGKLIKKQTL